MANISPIKTSKVATPKRIPFWLASLLLLAVTLVAYWPALHGGLVWDDDSWTTKISNLLADLKGLGRMWTDYTALQQYYPLAGTSFWIDHHLWGFWTFPYHVENVVLHVCGALLFWKLLERLEVPGAWLAAAIFTLHPLMVESAAWITERKNVLSLVFYLGGLLAYGRFTDFWKQSENSQNKGRWHWYALAFVLLLCGLLTKTTTFCFGPVILLICWWKRGRVHWRKDILPALPFFILAIVLSGLTAWLEKNSVGAQGPDFALSFVQRFLIAGHVFWFYLGKLFWPAGLCSFYPYWHVTPASIGLWLYPVFAIGLIVALWCARNRIGRGPLTAVLYYVGTLFPVLGFLNAYYMRYSFVCDHWVYLSSLGIIACASAYLVKAAASFNRPKFFYGVTTGLLLLLAGLSWMRAGDYKDMETLWRTTLAKNPNSWLAYNNLGALLYGQGHDDEAISMLTKCIDLGLKTDVAAMHDNLGNALLHKKRVSEAMAQFQTAIKIEPQNPTAHYNFGNALMQTERLDEAIVEFKQALSINANYPEANNNLGVSLMRLGQLDDAKIYFDKSLALNPDYAEAHYNLGYVRENQHDLDGASREYQRALELKPDYGDACLSLAKLLITQHQFDKAIIYFNKTVELMPDNAEAQNNLANLLAAQGKLDDAIRHYARAAQIKPDNAEVHYNYAATLLMGGKLKEAIEQYNLAIALQPLVAQFHNRLGIALQMNKNFGEATTQFQEAAKLDPTYLSAINNLIWILATCPEKSFRDGARAVELAEQFIHSSPGSISPQFLDGVAAAYAEVGNFSKAIATVKQAIGLAEGQKNASLAELLRSRGKLYEANEAYHEP